MQFIRVQSFLLAVVIGFATVLISLGALGMMAPALAQGPELEKNVPVAQPPPPDDDWFFIIVFTDPAKIEITDLTGNPAGEGTHVGEVRCNRNNCSQKTQLDLTLPLTDPWSVEYKFTTRQALDPVEERAVVEGQGTISSRRGQKERFSFTATFQNNRDGTVWVRYEASRSDASFIIPRAPGRLEFQSR